MNGRSSLESSPLRAKDAATPEFETEIRLRYSAMAARIAAGVPLTLLHIGAEQIVVASGNGIDPAAVLVLAIGSRKTAGDHFKHEPPTPFEMETAIATVEDELAPARTMIAGGSTLISTDAAVREIALIAGVAPGAELTLPLDLLERTFARLAAVTLGRPASQEGIPTGAAFAATLLILREFMHHLKFSSITVRT